MRVSTEIKVFLPSTRFNVTVKTTTKPSFELAGIVHVVPLLPLSSIIS